MKKIALIAALLFLLGCVSGCMPSKDNPGQTTPPTSPGDPTQPTSPDDTPGPVITTKPADVTPSKISLSSIATPIVSERFYDADGTALVEYTYQNIFLIYSDAAVADALYLSMVNAMDYSAGLQDILTQARDAYSQAPANWEPYSYSVLFDTTRIDQNVISVYGKITTSTDEETTMQVSSSYSLIDGRHLTFGDIQGSAYHYYTLLTLIDAQLRSGPAAGQFFEDYQETLAEQLRSKDCTNWFFTETGLSFYYLPMEIAPNSQGTIVVEVPYSELQGLLKDDYFPGEDYTTSGGMYAQLFGDVDLFQYQQFAEVIQSSEGTEILLGTDGAVSDIRIALGTWNASATEFTPTATIFACDGLSAESAIVVQCDLPDSAPVLRLSYVSEGVEYSRYITQSGKDNSILLTD